jgi:alkylated DNA nucleotide flippase Atl1
MTPKILQNALKQKMPIRKLRYLCKKCIDSGNDKEIILNEFELFRSNIAIEDTYEETILDVMDALTGWCSPAFQIANYGNCNFDSNYDPFNFQELSRLIELSIINTDMFRNFYSFISFSVWRLKVFNLITLIPYGFLISYGRLAQWAETECSIRVSPRNIAWLRKKLYGYFGHQINIPLHRIVMKNDVFSAKDSPQIRVVANRLKDAEGILLNPQWM